MSPRQSVITRWGELVPTPWSNGGGITREVMSAPAGATVDDLAWRVSIADLDAAGPFSPFPGIDRVITLLQGDRVRLHGGGADTLLRLHQPYRFRGETATTCQLSGPARVLNLMVRRGQVSGEVRVQDARSDTCTEGAGQQLVVALGEHLTVGDPSGCTWALSRYDTLAGTGPFTVPSGVFAVVSLAPDPSS